jgi:hypothetical protein
MFLLLRRHKTYISGFAGKKVGLFTSLGVGLPREKSVLLDFFATAILKY